MPNAVATSTEQQIYHSASIIGKYCKSVVIVWHTGQCHCCADIYKKNNVLYKLKEKQLSDVQHLHIHIL